jgi:hypothetical protein
MTLRRVVSLLCLAVTATALTGCAGGDTLSLDPVASAATKTADSTSARVAFAANMNIDGVGGMSFSGTGIYDGKSKSGALNMNFNMPQAMQSQLGGNPKMEMIFDGSDGFILYMRSSLFDKALPAGSWVKMDLQKLAKKEGVDLSSLMNANQADPSQTLGMLAASEDAHVVNYDRVRGVLTTHYRLNVDLKRLAKKNQALSDSLEKLMDMSGIDSYPAEAWIDAKGHVRKIKIDMSFNSPMGGAFTMTMTEELYDFGVKATIQPPPASQTVDMSALLGRS